MELAAIVGIGSAVGAVVMYVIRAEMRGDVTRLDGRLNTHEAGCTQRQLALDTRLDSMDKKLDRQDEKLDRLMERR